MEKADDGSGVASFVRAAPRPRPDALLLGSGRAWSVFGSSAPSPEPASRGDRDTSWM